jgi:hypothetical protein
MDEELAVYPISADGKEFFAGESMNAKSQMLTETLKPAK